MEDVLSVYTRPRDPDRPVVCLDETSKQLVAETHAPVAMQPGLPARVDYEYARNGVANLFMMFAPLEGWRHVKVTDRRTAVDYAHVLKDLADVHFAQAETIVLIQDNLNTHAAASLYEAFPAPEARRLVERFEWHYTPKHGSWLDLAESELGVLASQCLDRRIPDGPSSFVDRERAAHQRLGLGEAVRVLKQRREIVEAHRHIADDPDRSSSRRSPAHGASAVSASARRFVILKQHCARLLRPIATLG